MKPSSVTRTASLPSALVLATALMFAIPQKLDAQRTAEASALRSPGRLPSANDRGGPGTDARPMALSRRRATALGIVIGAVAGGVGAYYITAATCDRCDDPGPAWASAALGAVVGGVLGEVTGSSFGSRESQPAPGEHRPPAAAPGSARREERGCDTAVALPRNSLEERIRFLGAISYCRERGPALLIEEWRKGGSEESLLRALVYASIAMRSRTVLEEVVAIAGRASEGRVLRMAAIGVMLPVLNPNAIGFVVETPREPVRVYLEIVLMSHASGVGQDTELRAGMSGAVRSLLSNLAQSEADAAVRSAATVAMAMMTGR